MGLTNSLEKIIKNPHSYVAAVVGALIGGIFGGLIGLTSGGFIGYFTIVNPSTAYLLQMDPRITIGSITGLVIGAVIGGGTITLITVYKIYKKTKNYSELSSDTISPILLSSIWISIQIAIGMGLGAVIGSLKLPGYGTCLGAVLGTILILFTSTL